MATTPRGKPLPKLFLDLLTTVEIFVYRCAVIVTFVVYADKHIKEQLGR